MKKRFFFSLLFAVGILLAVAKCGSDTTSTSTTAIPQIDLNNCGGSQCMQ